MSEILVTREDQGPVAIVTLDRPQQRNALSRALMAQLRDIIDKLSVDQAIESLLTRPIKSEQ